MDDRFDPEVLDAPGELGDAASGELRPAVHCDPPVAAVEDDEAAEGTVHHVAS